MFQLIEPVINFNIYNVMATCCIAVLFSQLKDGVSLLASDALDGQEVSLVRSCFDFRSGQRSN